MIPKGKSTKSDKGAITEARPRQHPDSRAGVLDGKGSAGPSSHRGPSKASEYTCVCPCGPWKRAGPRQQTPGEPRGPRLQG